MAEKLVLKFPSCHYTAWQVGTRVLQNHVFWVCRANEGDKTLVPNNGTKLLEQKMPKPTILFQGS